MKRARVRSYTQKVLCFALMACLFFAAVTLPGAVAESDASGSYVRHFMGKPVLGVNWVYMTETGNPGGVKIGTFCAHPKMASGGPGGYVQYYITDGKNSNPALDAMIKHMGLNAANMSELRYLITFGMTNKLMDTQTAFWAYLNLRRPDMYERRTGTQAYNLSGAAINGMSRMDYWLNSVPGSYAGLNVPGPKTGLYPGDTAHIKHSYGGASYSDGQDVSADLTGGLDVAGPFKLEWDQTGSFSPALAQINYGASKNRAPEFNMTSTDCRIYLSSDPGAQPVRTVALGQEFYVRYTGFGTSGTVNITPSKEIVTKVNADQFFYSFNSQYQYTVDLEKYEGFKIRLTVDPADQPDPAFPSVQKDVAQYNGSNNSGEYEDVKEMDVGSDAIWRVTLENVSKPGLDLLYRFGYRDFNLPDNDPGVHYVRNATDFINITGKNRIKLMADIDMTGFSGTNPSLTNAIFDGNGHTIKNYSNNSVLFLEITNSAVANLRFEDFTINAPHYGAIVRMASGSEFRNIYFNNINFTTSNAGNSSALFGHLEDCVVSGITAENVHVRSTGIPARNNASQTKANYTTGLLVGRSSGSVSYFDINILGGSIYAQNNTPLAAFGYYDIKDARNLYFDNININGLQFVSSGQSQGLHVFGLISANTDYYLPSTNRIPAAEITDSVSIKNYTFKGIVDGKTGYTDRFAGIGHLTAKNIDVENCIIDVAGQVIMNGDTDLPASPNAQDMALTYHYATAGAVVVTEGMTLPSYDSASMGNYSIHNVTANASFKVLPPAGGRTAPTSAFSGVALMRGPGDLSVIDCQADIAVDISGYASSGAQVINYAGGIYSHWYDGTAGGAESIDFIDRQRNIVIMDCIGGLTITKGGRTVQSAAQIAAVRYGTTTITSCHGIGVAAATEGEARIWSTAQIYPNVVVTGSGNRQTYNDGATNHDDEFGEYDLVVPRLTAAGYQKIQVIYVFDYYTDQNGGRGLLHESAHAGPGAGSWGTVNNTGKLGIAASRYRPAPDIMGGNQVDVLLKSGDSDLYFYPITTSLPKGVYHNEVYIYPGLYTWGSDGKPMWRGGDDDAWVIVKERYAKLNIVKMLEDNDYYTVAGGCTFTLTELATGRLVGEITPDGVLGETFTEALKPGFIYVLRETAAPGHMSGMVGRMWYITVTDGKLRVYHNVDNGKAAPNLSNPAHDMGDESFGGTLKSDGVTTEYSFKVLNTLNNNVPRGRLTVQKYNENGSSLLSGTATYTDGVLSGWTGAMYAVLRCETGDFASLPEQPEQPQPYGHILMPGYSIAAPGPGVDANYYQSIDLPQGYYILTELKAPDGWALDPTEFWITVAPDGKITVVDNHPDIDQVAYLDGKQSLAALIDGDGTDAVTVRANNKKPDYRLQVMKTDAAARTAMSGVNFVVNGINGTVYRSTATTSPLGIAVIDFPQTNGTYTVTETAPAGYRAVAPYTIRNIDGEMYISGGPDNLQNIVVVTGGYVFSKIGEGYTLLTDEQIAANNLSVVDDGALIARTSIGLQVKNHLLTSSDPTPTPNPPSSPSPTPTPTPTPTPRESTETSESTESGENSDSGSNTRIPGGTDPYQPPVPRVPGHNVVPDGDGFIELDENGVPLGRWGWDSDEESWIFDELVPLADMPATGVSMKNELLLISLGFALIMSNLLIALIRNRRTRFAKRR